MSENIESRVRRFIRENDLTGSKLVLAVSGGPDSVCLLHTLSNLKTELELDLHVAHLDHRLRGAESDADAEYVAALAQGLGLPVTIGHADVKAFQLAGRKTLEEAAREVRYSFLADVCQNVGARLIVTGHTRSDHAETILLHILRGSGTRGLVGLKPLTPRIIDDAEVIIVRPMLDITREETASYCQQSGLDPRLDASNLDPAPLRNKIRLELLPLLSAYNSNITDALLRLSANAAEELDYLDEQADALCGRALKREGDVLTFDREELKDVHPALIRHLFRACFEQLPGGLKDIESRHIEDMLELLDKPAGRRIDLPYGLVFMAGYDSFRLGKEADLPCPFPPLDGEYALSIPGITELPGWRVEASLVHAIDTNDNSLAACMDSGAAGKKLSVRTWKRGDRFQPIGMGCEKKLGEFMIDARIPRLWRRNIPLVVSPVGIAWLAGYRLDERFKVTSTTKKILRLEFKRV